MKKYLVIICILVIVLATSCGNKFTTYTEINYVEYLEKLDNGDTFPLVIGSKTCSACALFKGTIEKLIKEYQVEVFYIDISKINQEEYNNLKTQVSFSGTPTTIFIDSGQMTSIYNRIDGAESYSKIKAIFKNNNYID